MKLRIKQPFCWSVLVCGGALLAAPLQAHATEGTVPMETQSQQAAGTCTGTVVDETGEPLLGATVKVEGGKIATSTNIDGEFSLSNVKPGSKITVSFIGYTPVTVVWNGQPLSIKLAESANTLDEVVVMGYGVEQKRGNVTNSIAKVSEKTLTVGTNANPAQALAGAISGVKVNITSGNPSATPDIVIRGGTDWNGSNKPLYVIDGQIRENLSDINPNDIESMEILKDAGATALYGARAANGVVLIRSKQGKAGEGRVTLSAKYGINWNGDTGYEWPNAGEYLQNIWGAIANTPWANYKAYFDAQNYAQGCGFGSTEITSRTQYNVLTKTDKNAYLLEKGWQEIDAPLPNPADPSDPINAPYLNRKVLYRDLNFLEVNLKNPTHTQDYNLAFQGGNDRANYYASLGYYDAEGAFASIFYKRYNFSFTGGYKISDWLQANSTFTFTRANWNNESNGVSSEWLFARGMSTPPTLRLLDEDNQPLLGAGNPSINTNYQPEKFQRDNQSDKFQMTQSLKATIMPGLTVTGTMSWYYIDQWAQSFNKNYLTNVGNGAWNNNHASSVTAYRWFNQTYNLVANFKRTFAEKHNINAMVGMEYYKGSYKYLQASGSQAPTDDFPALGLTSTKENMRNIGSDLNEDAILSYMGRVEYNYAEKYLLAATFREDGYSRLQDNRWGFFPGVSAGWVFSNEDFWKKTDALSFINYAKLRGSFGLNGIVNTNIIQYYNLQGSYNASMYGGVYGYRIGNLPNLGLRWERTRTAEVGLDLGFLQNRINLGLTYYNRLTMDKYANKSLPQTTGFSSVVSNNGKFRNQGVEIDIQGTILRSRDFSWTIGANLTFNKNIVVELPESDLPNNAQNATEAYVLGGEKNSDGSYKMEYLGGLQEGKEPGRFIGWKKSHMVRSQADLDALGDYIDISGGKKIYATEAGRQRLLQLGYAAGTLISMVPGDIAWADRNNDNMIDNYDVWDLGNTTFHWTGGFNTTFTWKGLSLYARFDMGFDKTVNDGMLGWWLGCGQGMWSAPKQVNETFSASNPDGKYPIYVWADQNGKRNYFRQSDLLAQSGSYLACRELSLSYTLPTEITKKFRCQGLTVSFTGQNLGYIKSCTIPLPDRVGSWAAGSSDAAGTYNLPRTFIMGLNISF